MGYLNGFTILLIFQLAGEIITRSLKTSIPGPVIGMGLLLLLLIIMGRVPLMIERASASLLSHFSLLFVPAGVGMMLYFDELSNDWLIIAIILMTSTAITLAGTGLIAKLSNAYFSKQSRENHED